MNTKERSTLTTLYAIIQAIDTSHYPPKSSPITDLAHAWGIGRTTVKDIFKTVLDRNNDPKRKRRSDAGLTVFNSDKRRRSLYNGFDYFKRHERARRPGEIITNQELKEEWQGLDDNQQKIFENAAEDFQLTRAVFLPDEVGRLLRKAKGHVAWRTLATKLAGTNDNVKPVSHNTVRTYVMGLTGSCYKIPRILPMLTGQTKRFRLEWAKQWHLFWYGSRLIAGSVQVMLVMNDEKWFFSLVIRSHQKCVPFYGVGPVFHHVHHRNHIEKILGLCTTAFLPFDNDFQKGRRALKIDLQRAGGLIVADRDTFRRVYRDDGTYHYPRNPESRLRIAGQQYFQNWEITGSNEGTPTDRKFSLLKYWREELFPILDKKVQQLQQEMNKQIVVRFQWDNAPPHIDDKLTKFLDAEFSIRGWLLVPQPPNSPLTNTQDAYLFPALAKRVTGEQGLENGGRYLQGEKLWETVNNCFQTYPEETIARSFMHHQQIVSAILACDGGDDFMKESRFLHCGIRKVVQPFYENEGDENPSGVQLIDTLEPFELDEALRYNNSPYLFDWSPAELLTFDELNLLTENMDPNDVDFDFFASGGVELLETSNL